MRISDPGQKSLLIIRTDQHWSKDHALLGRVIDTSLVSAKGGPNRLKTSKSWPVKRLKLRTIPVELRSAHSIPGIPRSTPSPHREVGDQKVGEGGAGWSVTVVARTVQSPLPWRYPTVPVVEGVT